MICAQLLGERYRFKEDCLPAQLPPAQKLARRLFLEKIHRKANYISITECPYCGRHGFTKISEVDKRGLPSDIVTCNFCDGCFKSTILNSQANRFHYQNISYILRGKEACAQARERTFWQRLNSFAYPRYYFISHFLALKPGRDFIVEFGCNDGANLYPWHKNGFDVLGIELDAKMLESGKRNKLNLVSGDLLSYNHFDKKPNLIILAHVLEHAEDVNLVLKRLFELLEPGGYLFLEVPGIRAQGLSDTLRYFDVEHNYYFDLNSLSRLLERHRFKLLYGDEYIRLLCTPIQNQRIFSFKNSAISLDKIKSRVLKLLIDIFGLKKKKLRHLLKERKRRNLKNRILGKLNRLYFQYHYASFGNSGKKNANVPS